MTFVLLLPKKQLYLTNSLPFIAVVIPASFEHDQRKNNLCRRIRIEKQKKEKEGGKSTKDEHAILKVQHKGAPAQLAPQPPTLPSVDSATAAAVQGPSPGERRDSFLEEIMDLPGVGDFDIGGDDDLGFLQDY